jgi:hypothetical protein
MQPTPPKPMTKKKRLQEYQMSQGNESFGAKPSYKNLNVE